MPQAAPTEVRQVRIRAEAMTGGTAAGRAATGAVGRRLPPHPGHSPRGWPALNGIALRAQIARANDPANLARRLEHP